MNMVIGTSLGSAVLIYETVGLLGYLTFGSKVASNIMESYVSSPIIDVCRLLISINTLFSYPLQLQPCRNSILKILQSKPNAEAPRLWFNAVTCVILATTFLIALSVTQLEVILAFVGSTGSTAISFILPALFYIKLHSNATGVSRAAKATLGLAYFLFIYGFVIMVTCLSLVRYVFFFLSLDSEDCSKQLCPQNIYELVQPSHQVGRGKPHHGP